MTTPSIRAHCDELDQTFRQIVEQLETAQAEAHRLPEQSLNGMHDSVENILADCEESLRKLHHSMALLESLWQRGLGQTDQLVPPSLMKRIVKNIGKGVSAAQIGVTLISNLAGSVNPNYNQNDHLADHYSNVAASSEDEIRKREEEIRKAMEANEKGTQVANGE